ncbi:ATP-dependent DNA ligase [soil metagenome]
MTDFARLVETSTLVAATRSRRAKSDLIAGFLGSREVAAVSPAVAFLSGVIPQGSLGVGWATLAELPSPASTPSLDVASVMESFDALTATSGPGSHARRRRLIDELFGAATEDEQRFLLGLMTGDIRQGALEGVMIDAVARAADVAAASVRRATMLDGRVWEVAAVALSRGEAGLAGVALTLFRPIKPMLAQSAATVEEAWKLTGMAAVEWKLDGIRIQTHRSGERVEIYTRNLNSVTGRLGEIVEAVRNLDCHQAVLDGEALSIDQAGRPARFQETAGRFGTDWATEVGLDVFFFDLLHLDGEDLIDAPFVTRRRRLEALAPKKLVPHRVAETPSESATVLRQALDAGHEGVVVKGVDSTYEAGRRGAAWVKVKPVHTLDLLVMAAEWGHGRRQGWLSNLHLGARDRDRFVMVGKTFKGLSDALLTWQTQLFQEIEDRRTRSTVYVHPEVVVEIAVDGVQVSTRYPGGVALRFARVRRYRPDKGPSEVDTIDTVRAIAGLGALGA